MTATLSNTQANLPQLVEIASRGEDIVITIEGKPMARLTKAELEMEQAVPSQAKADLHLRAAEPSSLREKYQTGKLGLSVDQILEETRADRE